MRAGRTSRSRIDAGTAAPCSCSTTSRRASGPRRIAGGPGAPCPAAGGEDGGLPRREAACDVDRGERPVGPRVARDDLAQRVGLLLEEGGGQPRRGGDSQGVAQAPRVLGGGPALLARDADPDGPPTPL